MKYNSLLKFSPRKIIPKTMKYTIIHINKLLIFFILFSSSVRIGLADEDINIDQKLSVEVKNTMKQFIDDHEISGSVTYVFHKGKVIHNQAQGYANIENKIPMTTDHLFILASVTKTITSLPILMLQDKGVLDINDLVSDHLPILKHAKVKGQHSSAELRIKHLLSHTSGIELTRDGVVSLDDRIIEAATRPLHFEPGTKWMYGRGFNIAAKIVEKYSGLSFEEFVEKEILKPLKMTHTTFNPNKQQLENLATTYFPPVEKGLDPIAVTSQGLVQPAPGPSGGLYSTSHDLGRFYQMILNQGQLDQVRILSQRSIKLLLSSQTDGIEKVGHGDGMTHNWSLGYAIRKESEKNGFNKGTFGHGGGSGTHAWIDPVTETIYIFLIQRRYRKSNNAWSSFKKLATATVKNLDQ